MNFRTKTIMLVLGLALANVASVRAQSAAPGVVWHPGTLLEAIGSTAVFGLIGIALAIIGFKLFDFFTPFDLEKEICQEKNVAVGILCGSIILGVCYIVATAIS